MAQIDTLLQDMLEMGGSDLHLTVGVPPKARVSGSLHSMDYEPLSEELLTGMLSEITPEYRWDHFEESGDADLAHEIPQVARFRLNLFRNHWGIGAVFRQIPAKVDTLDELGLPDVLKRISNFQDGLILVTGPTGSGKSTTLAAMLNHINEKQAKQIITIEDPIEFSHDNQKSSILHREVGAHCHSFSSGLKGALRADPDVILIGELRDRETMKLALTCAAMGMVVFGTLHTNNATKTIDRLIDAFPAEEQNQVRVMLAESLKAIVSQLLCKREGGGRAAVHEILTEHEALPNAIRQGALSSIRNIIDQNRDKGMISMDASLRDLLQKGLISQNEAYMKAIDKSSFAPA